MRKSPDQIMTIATLAEYLKISRSTPYKLVQKSKLPGRKVGKRWRFHKSAIDDWLRHPPEHLGDKREAKE